MQTKLVQTIALAATLSAVACGSDSSASGGSAGQPTGTAGANASAGAAQGGSAGLSGVAGGTAAGAGGASAGAAGATAGSPGGGSANGGTGGASAGAGGAVATGGSGGAGGGVAGTKFVGNITTGDSADTAGLTYSKYWNQITPENAGKWGSVQSSASGAFNWATLDAIYDYAKKNNIIFKQHNFVWGSQQPSGTITQANVQNWISSFCTRYPETKLIDVVNEPPPHTTPAYAAAIGGGTNGDWKWITNTFTWARQSCGNAILILNDYNNVEYGNDENHFIDIVKAIKTGGAPIDAVGAQAHDVNKLSAATLQTNLNTLNTQTGLPVYITEYDVSNADDNAQLATYKAQFPIFMNTSFVHGVTIWGWIYGKTWSQAADSGLVKSGKSRPAMTWLMEQVGKTGP